MVKHILEIWYHPGWNSLEIHEWNACYCHPNDLTIFRSKNIRKNGCYGYVNKSSHTKQMKKSNWVRIERQIKIIKQ